MKEYKEKRHSILYKNTADLSFYSAGIEKCRPSYKYGPRIRPYHLIHFVLEGEGELKIKGCEFKLKKGDVFIIPADETSWYKADDNNPWTYAWVSFLGLYSQTYLDQIMRSLPESFVIRGINLDEYETLIKELLFLDSNTTSTYFLCNSILLKIISYLFRDIAFDEDNWGEYNLADQVKFYLEMNYSQPILISDVARDFGIHPNYLTQIFRNKFGTTPKKFLNELKYQKAKGLLTNTNLPISVVSASVGIEDNLSFTKTFKRLYGESPSDYRKKNKENGT